MLSIGLWGKVGLHLRGNVLGYELLKCPKNLVVLGARTVEEAAHLFDQPEFHEKELLPFYDRHLKGAGDRSVEGRPVRIFVRGADVGAGGGVAFEARQIHAVLPAAGAVGERHLAQRRRPLGRGVRRRTARNRRATTIPTPKWRNGVVAMGKWGPDFVGRVLTFTSEALADDLEVTGPIVLELYASSERADTDFFIKLADQHPQAADQRKEGRPPAFVNVTKGWLKASHRELDPARAMPHRPIPSHANPQPLAPGRSYRFDIEIHPASYVFKRGHRIRLDRQRRFAPDGLLLLARLSAAQDGNRHGLPRPGAALPADAAGGAGGVNGPVRLRERALIGDRHARARPRNHVLRAAGGRTRRGWPLRAGPDDQRSENASQSPSSCRVSANSSSTVNGRAISFCSTHRSMISSSALRFCSMPKRSRSSGVPSVGMRAARLLSRILWHKLLHDVRP